MSEYTVAMPSLGDDAVESVKVSFIYVKVGDAVAFDADLIEVVTDKATFNVPSPKAGKVVKLLIREDDDLKIGQPLCLLETD